MDLMPADPYTWTRVVRRCQLGATVKSVAWVLADYASRDGRDVRPGVDLLMADTELSKSSVVRALKRLRDVGLIERVFEGSAQGRRALADEYRLTFPGDLAMRVPMRGPEGFEYPSADAGRVPDDGGSGVSQQPDPPAGPVDNPGSGVSEPPDMASVAQLPTGNQVSQVPGTGVTGTQIRCHTDTPPTNDLPSTYQDAEISSYGAEVEGTRAAAAPVENPEDRQRLDDTPEYVAARDHLARLPDLGAELLTQARADLGDGTLLARLVIHAYQIALGRPA